MGRPDKQPRSKGNMKPASSSRAAELASSTTSPLNFQNLGGFAQFANPTQASVAAVHNSRPSTPLSDTSETPVELEPELVVVLKKLSKRDTVTKLKALEELEEYLKTYPATAASILPTWATLYVKLALEVDRRVRLATASVHIHIVSGAKKKLAPYLKNIIGAWMIAMYDASKDVATKSKAAFETVFSSDKRQGVIAFCQEEIIHYMSEILLRETPDTLSDARHVSKEDMAAKYARIIASSFGCISYLIEDLPNDERQKLAHEYDTLLDSPDLWNFVSNKNAVIRKAVYSFTKSLVLHGKDLLKPRLVVVSPYFFGSAFTEKDTTTHSEMWDALLLLTKTFPESWNMAFKNKPALSKLCTFLRAGLNGSVNITYPALLPLLANMPVEISGSPNFCKDVFTSFWKGLSSGDIDASNSSVLVEAYTECVLHFATLTSKQVEEESAKEQTAFLIEHATWDAIKACFVSGRDSAAYYDKLAPNVHLIMAKHVVSLSTTDGVCGYMSPIWTNLGTLLVQTVTECTPPPNYSTHLDTFFKRTGDFLVAMQTLPESLSVARRIVSTSLTSSIKHRQYSQDLLALSTTLLDDLPLDFAGPAAKEATTTASQLLTFLSEGPEASLKSLIVLYTTIILKHPDSTDAKDMFDALVVEITKTPDRDLQAEAVLYLLEKLKFRPKDAENRCTTMDDLLKKFALDTFHDAQVSADIRSKAEHIVALGLTLRQSLFILSEPATNTIIADFGKSLKTLNDSQFISPGQAKLEDLPVGVTHAALSSLHVLKKFSYAKSDADSMLFTPSIIGEIFDAMFLKQEDTEDAWGKASALALVVWDIIISKPSITLHLADTLLERIKVTLCDTRSCISPVDSARRVNRLLSSLYLNQEKEHQRKVVNLLIGTEASWEATTAPFAAHTVDFLSLAIVDPYAGLVQPTFLDSDELVPLSFDVYGLGEHARLAIFATEFIASTSVPVFFFGDNKDSERDWIMMQLMLTRFECEYGLQVPGLCRIWDSQLEASTIAIKAFVDQMDKLFEEWLLTLLSDTKEWPKELVNAISSRTDTSVANNRLVALLLSLLKYTDESRLNQECTAKDAAVSKLFQKIFTHMLDHLEWQSDDLLHWITLVKTNSTELHLLIKVALVESMKCYIGETQVFRHLQSHLASNLSDITSLQAFADGDPKAWSRLVLLNSTALEFAVAIPTQRLIFLIQSFQKSFKSETEDHLSVLERSQVLVQIARLFSIMAESVQEISGSHWDFFLNKSFEWVAYFDASTVEEVALVYHGLKLYGTIYQLASNNNDSMHDELKSNTSRFNNILLNLFTKECGKNDLNLSQPYKELQTLISHLLEDIPEKTLLEEDRFINICELLDAPNEIVQKRAYALLQMLITHKVKDLSVQLEFTQKADEETDASIDGCLFDRLLRTPDLSLWPFEGLNEEPIHETFGFLTGWLLMLDHFNDITFNLKQAYMSQLKDSDAMSRLLPTLFQILSVGTGRDTRPFDLSNWSVDIYDIEGFDASSEFSFQLLAAHIYYKTLRYIPSLVRSWWTDCKNRQLKLAVEEYTEKYYSSLLISSELELLNRPDIKSQLQNNGENEFSVKVLNSANEVKALYRVDEQTMQIAIKLPKNYPLRQIDVEGVQKVGVTDRQWHGWMFVVSSVIGSQNGNIVDALTVFKRNVNLHFSGVEDCTICYSIISLVDRSIPKKQCRTCKHKFHSSCLYKWFRTSNSASCPLCRTVF